LPKDKGQNDNKWSAIKDYQYYFSKLAYPVYPFKNKFIFKKILNCTILADTSVVNTAHYCPNLSQFCQEEI
jgi:hypothetical protein